MISFEKRRMVTVLALLCLSSLPARLLAAQNFDIDLKELDQEKPAAKPAAKSKPSKKAHKHEPTKHGRVRAKVEGGYARYTIKPGDHIFKVLVTEFGMSNEKAEKLIPEIIRINNISNIHTLTVGKTLLIPLGEHHKHVARGPHKERGGAEVVQDQMQPLSVLEPPPRAQEPVVQSAPEVRPHNAGAPVMQHEERPQPVTARREPAPPVLAAPAVTGTTWVCSVRETDPRRVIDSFLGALGVRWSKNRIVESGDGSPTAFSIMVDRYFELRGTRYIITVGESDPYSYTLIRLLEGAGYKVLRLTGREDFSAVGEKLLKLVGVIPNFGRYPVGTGDRQNTGFLIPEEEAGGRRVLVTNEAVDRKLRFVMEDSCSGR